MIDKDPVAIMNVIRDAVRRNDIDKISIYAFKLYKIEDSYLRKFDNATLDAVVIEFKERVLNVPSIADNLVFPLSAIYNSWVKNRISHVFQRETMIKKVEFARHINDLVFEHIYTDLNSEDYDIENILKHSEHKVCLSYGYSSMIPEQAPFLTKNAWCLEIDYHLTFDPKTMDKNKNVEWELRMWPIGMTAYTEIEDDLTVKIPDSDNNGDLYLSFVETFGNFRIIRAKFLRKLINNLLPEVERDEFELEIQNEEEEAEDAIFE
jgi:hypothetical protein